VLIAAAVFATLGEGDNGGKASSGGNKTATTAKAPASTQKNPIPIGTDVEVAKGWNLKVNSAEMNANATVAAGNEFNTPDPGKQYVLVNVTITNHSDQPEAPLVNMKISLLPASGVAVDATFVAGVSGGLDTTAQMQPGASATGTIPFQVPSDQVTGTVLLGQSQFTIDAAKDEKFFAIQ
jgi:hypothetical protein